MEIILDSKYGPRRKQGIKITWTPGMIEKLKTEFPIRFNKDLASELGVGWRTLLRKARELKLEKVPGFIDNNRREIVRRIAVARRPNPTKGMKGWSVPNSEQYRFKKGNISCMTDPQICKKAHDKRNDTIRRERVRIKYGFPQLTKLKLKAI